MVLEGGDRWNAMPKLMYYFDSDARSMLTLARKYLQLPLLTRSLQLSLLTHSLQLSILTRSIRGDSDP